MSTEVSEVTRRTIVDALTASEIGWSGRLGEDDFLARLYDLTKLPSHDHRYKTAAGDIHQHRINNLDWSDDWVFYDERFNLLHCADESFLRFLCETAHPVVRPAADEARRLVEIYNVELNNDGWEIFEQKKMSGKPLFAPRKLGTHITIFEEPTGWQKVDRQLQEMRTRLDSAENEEQYQAVGLLCREILISVAQETFKVETHPTLDGIKPSDTDAKRMLEAVFEAELNGSSNKEARVHAKAAVGLALALQHKRTADFRTAALCAEGTFSVVNMLAVLSARRGRSLS